MIDLGTLYTTITADTKGLDKALNGVKNFATLSIKAVGAVSVAATGAVAAAGALVNSVAAQTKELSNLSVVAGTTASELQAYGYAASTVGIDTEKLADISKDVFDKLQDYAATGAGGAVDFFEQIGDAAGITAEDLMKLSGPEVLGAMKTAMDEAGLSTKQQIFYLESMASDSSLLIPLLGQNAAGMKELADRAKELGVVLSEIDISNLNAAAGATKEFGASFEALKQKAAAGLAPIYTFIVQKLTVAIQDFNKSFTSEDITRWAIEAGTAILTFAQDSIEVFEGTYIAINRVVGVLKLATAGFLQLAQGVQWFLEKYVTAISYLKNNPITKYHPAFILARKAGELAGMGDDVLESDFFDPNYWKDAQKTTEDMIQGVLKTADESFNKADTGISWADDLGKGIGKLKQQLEGIEADAISKKITKPIEEVTDQSIPKMGTAIRETWIEGGDTAITQIEGMNEGLGQTKNITAGILEDLTKMGNMDVNVNVTSGLQNGGMVGAFKKGGQIIKAASGKFFPGFGGGDKIPILGEAGEYMINKYSVRDAGVSTAAAFNRGDWGTVVSNLMQKMKSGGAIGAPALALANGGAAQSTEAMRRYYIQGNSDPIDVRADSRNADKLIAALSRKNDRRNK